MNNINSIAVKKYSPTETLKSIAVGETVVIKDRYIKANVIRSAMSRLNKYGYNFYSKTCADGTMVTRTE